MTVPATARRAGPFNGNGATTTFGFAFKVFAASDLRVVRLVVATGVQTDAVQGVDYTATLNPDQESSPGGSVVFGVAPPTGTTITIVSTLAYAQPVDLPDGGAYRAQQVEDALDRLAILAQQLDEQTQRSVRLAVSSVAVSTELPAAQPTALIGWDVAGTGLRNYSAGELGVNITYSEWLTQSFNGTGAATTFVLSIDAGVASNIDLRVNNVPQTPNVNFSYTPATRTITFLTGAPPTGTGNVVARYGRALPVGTVGTNVVGTAQIIDGAVTPAKLSVAYLTAGDNIGAATATTPSAGDNSTRVATTAYVRGEINAIPAQRALADQAQAEAGTDNTVDMSPLRTRQAIDARAVGLGQTWQNLTASRAMATNYTNSTARPIVVSVQCQQGSAAVITTILVGGVAVAWTAANGAGVNSLGVSAIVPPGAVYRVENGNLLNWAELR